MRLLRVPLAIATALAGLAFAVPSGAHAAGITLACPDFATLSAAIPTSNGSATINITNNSAAPCTVNFTDTIDIPSGVTVTIVNPLGSGVVQFDGGNSNELFDVSFRGTLSLTGLTLQNASIDDDGGAIYNNGTLNVTNCTFKNNSATDGSGGAIYSGGTLTVTNSVFTGNSSVDEGGAIATGESGPTTITTSTFTDNTASEAGAIANGGGDTMLLTRSTVANNTATDVRDSGGGGIENDGHLTIANTTITGNDAGTAAGGGIFFEGGTMTIVNSTISGNFAGVAGGIFVGGALTIGNTIIAGNQINSVCLSKSLSCLGAPSNNAAHPTSTKHHSNPDESPSVRNQLNLVGFAPDILVCGPPVIDLGHNLIGDGTGSGSSFSPANGDLVGTSASPINPLLGSLRDNGGPTQTMALLTGSPAIGLGLASLCLSPIADIDERGIPRHATVRGACDAGAYDSSTITAAGALNALLVSPGMADRLGFAGSETPVTFTLGYITFQDGISTLIARQPISTIRTTTCPATGPCLDTLTLTGTIGSTKGSLFAIGGTVQVILTTQVSGVVPVRTVISVEVKIFPPASLTPVVDSTWTGPFTGNRRVVLG